MNRRFLLAMVALASRLPAQPGRASIRGRLTAAAGGAPAVDVPGRGLVLLDGDAPTRGVLKDARLAGSDFEAIGHYLSERSFEIDPIHLRAMFVHRGGKRLFITYWCDLCAIRTYTPGLCWCCQQETALDLRGKDDS